MKISLKWLSDYIDIQDYFSKPKDLAALLTGAGLEVESISDQGKQFESVVIGHILKKDQHPNADRLSLCQVSIGDGRVQQIVCGAQNHKQDDRVVVALPGAILPGDFAIKISKIRGVESSGMLCSEKELGLKAESEGILILPQNAPIGKSYAEYMGFDDILFELKVTPNRADCLSHFGLAREIGCLLGRPCALPIESLIEGSQSTKQLVRVEVKNSDLCPRYAGRAMTNLKVAPSPDWLKKRLESVGVKAINNVVDVTNFVMHELGQPLHAFDINEIKGAKIIVDQAKPGEKFTTLDGSEKTLKGEELSIRDQERVIALAGIVGGKNSGIQNETKNIFIEAAYFSASHIRKNARALGIETDSSYRFSRGVNPEAVPLAMNRAAQLIQSLAGGEIASEAYDIYPHAIVKKPIEISLDLLSQRLGFKIEASVFVSWMKRLGCQISDGRSTANLATDLGSESWQILPPVFRTDINIDMDLVEEFARLHGYHHIPEALPALHHSPSQDSTSFQNDKRLRRMLVQQGFHQVIHYAFTSEKWQNQILGDVSKLTQYGLRSDAKAVHLMNPLNEELGVMRTSLLPGLIKNVAHNFHNAVHDGRVFEIGFAHFASIGENGQAKYEQETRLAIALWGFDFNLWKKTQNALAAFELKSNLLSLFKKLGINKFSFESKEAPAEFLHPKQSVALVSETKPIGLMGSLHPNILEDLKIRTDVAVMELNVDKLMQGQPRVLRYAPISRQPFVDRDLSFVMPRDLQAAQVEAVIKQNAGSFLKEIKIVDVFVGGHLKENEQSVSFRLLFQDQNLSLEDAQVNEIRDKIINAVSQRFQIALR